MSVEIPVSERAFTAVDKNGVRRRFGTLFKKRYCSKLKWKCNSFFI